MAETEKIKKIEDSINLLPADYEPKMVTDAAYDNTIIQDVIDDVDELITDLGKKTVKDHQQCIEKLQALKRLLGTFGRPNIEPTNRQETITTMKKIVSWLKSNCQ